MKAGVVHAKNDIRWEEIDKPTAAPGKVLIKVKYTGICGSDVPESTAMPAIIIPMYWDMNFPVLWKSSAKV